MTNDDKKKKPEDPESKDLAISEDAFLNAPFNDLEQYSFDKYLEEINVLDLEGYLFAYDPRNKGLKLGKHEYDLGGGRTLILKFDEDYGQPSSLAYRVLQAVFKKITDEGQPFYGVANFTARELNSLCGRSQWGGEQGAQLYHAIKSLHTTRIEAQLLDKDTSDYKEVSFSLFPKLYLSGKKVGDSPEVHSCSIFLEQEIVDSLNKDYWVAFNWDTLSSLQPISMALYKRLYKHFAFIYSQHLGKMKARNGISERALVAARRGVKFEKAYANVIEEWFGGGIKQWRYKSDVKKSLGPHLDALKSTKLIRSWSIEKMKTTGAMKLVFKPGRDFFRDYEKLWLGQYQPQFRFQQSTALREIQEPLQLVAHFYTTLTGSGLDIYPESANDFALELIETYGYDEAIDLVEFAITKAKETGFDIQTIQGISSAVPAWKVSVEHRERTQKRLQAVAEEQHQAKIQAEYDDYLASHVQEFRDGLSKDSLADFEKKAAQEYEASTPEPADGENSLSKKMRPMGIRIKLKQLLTKASAPLSIEDWKASKQAK